ncbi:hypothetical protein GCM10022403_017210 [Streptomyces coacervatus]|uniref:Uncharacterized protein n=1 Tax=Streptomyces coacervatus TaxID=647381 RepID=A0ABP7H332_9ACTN
MDTVDPALVAGVVSRVGAAPSAPSGRVAPVAVPAPASVSADRASDRAPGAREGVADRAAGRGEAT